MPPVPVRIDDPITPTKPQGATPQTAERPEAAPANNATTTSHNESPAYPPARPGAAAVPAPTPYVPRPQPEPTRTQAYATAQNVPPPPQPGAVPVAPGQQAHMTSQSTLPPPPKVGETLQSRQAPMPSQMQVPPPNQNYASTHSTSAYLPPSQAATTLNLGPVNPQPQAPHPPGYHQNTSAQEMTSTQRSSLEEQQRREGVLASIGGDSAGETAGSMWNTVKVWASTAGEKLAETEETVWKRINGR